MIEIRNHRIAVNGRLVPYRPTPNVSGVLKPEGIILHDTAGDLVGTGSVAWLCNPQAKASAHVVVDREGKITQLAPLNVRTWHAGQSSWKGRRFCNAFTIGIEIVNPGRMDKYGDGYSNGGAKGVKVPASFDVQRRKTKEHGDGYWLAYTEAQIATVTALCQAIRKAYGVTFIGTHWQIAPGRKVDTNPRFPLGDVIAAVFPPAGVQGFADMAQPAQDEDMSVGATADRPLYQSDDAANDDSGALSEPEIAGVQYRLKAMGYHEAGMPGVGGVGSRTIATVAAFKHDRGLEGAPAVDRALLDEIARAEREGFVRPIAPERAEGEPADSAIVKGAEKQASAGWWTGIAGGGGLLAWLSDQFDTLRGYVEPLRPFGRALHGYIASYWWLLALALAAYVLWQAARVRRADVENFQTGKTT